MKGIKGKKGSYDAYLIPEDIKDYSYTKDGEEIKGTQYKVRLEFSKRPCCNPSFPKRGK